MEEKKTNFNRRNEEPSVVNQRSKNQYPESIETQQALSQRGTVA
jgi:hypothetical protein